MKPDNPLKHPIADLIAKLQSLPPDTTYEETEGILYGGQCENKGEHLGTAYQMRVDIVEGLRNHTPETP